MMDWENRLHIPARRVLAPCEECGGRLNYPNLEVEPVAGMKVVLCRECLQRVVDDINRALQATSQEGN